VDGGADTAGRRGNVLRDGRFSARSFPPAATTSARPWQVALLVFVAAFCLYGLTASEQFQGYEPETNAAAEGFVLTGDFSIDPESPLRDPGAGSGGQLGEDGKLIPRAGLPSVLEKVPFYAAGKLVDNRSGDPESYTWRKGALSFADPFAAAAAAGFFFLAVWRLRRSMAWALVMAGIFTTASLAWPYSKAGMETVLMMGAILMLAAVLYAQDSPSCRPWAAAGFGAGLVLADKPYGILAVAAILALLVEPWHHADRRQRLRFLIAGAVPLLAWGVAFGVFNFTRTGGILDTGRSDPELTLAAPLNALGFMVSPGKGLLLYSPVVILGLLGLRAMWRENPRVARAIVGAFLGGLVVVAVLKFWSDETWGPRYIVWVAWLLLLPVPYWVTSVRRARVLAAVVVVAVAVQLLAVVAPPSALTLATKDLTGQPIFNRSTAAPLVTPFGRDPIRWIPELSPLLFQTKLVASYVSVKLGGPAVTTTYAPYEGPRRKVTLDTEHLAKYGFARPAVWWLQPGEGARRVGAVLFVVLGAFCLAMLLRVWQSSRVPRTPKPVPVR
jgi:hypothetical protein